MKKLLKLTISLFASALIILFFTNYNRIFPKTAGNRKEYSGIDMFKAVLFAQGELAQHIPELNDIYVLNDDQSNKNNLLNNTTSLDLLCAQISVNSPSFFVKFKAMIMSKDVFKITKSLLEARNEIDKVITKQSIVKEFNGSNAEKMSAYHRPYFKLLNHEYAEIKSRINSYDDTIVVVNDIPLFPIYPIYPLMEVMPVIRTQASTSNKNITEYKIQYQPLVACLFENRSKLTSERFISSLLSNL